MQPQRKPVNLFAIRSRERTYADAVRTNAMDGMEGMDVITKENERTVEKDGQIEGRDGINELEITDARTKSAPSPLAHSVDDSSGRMDSPANCAAASSLGRTHQSVSLKPDGGAKGEAVPAASSAQSGISFRLKDGSSVPLSSQIDECQLSVDTLASLKRVSEIYEAKPHMRVTAEILPYVIGRHTRRSQKAAKTTTGLALRWPVTPATKRKQRITT